MKKKYAFLWDSPVVRHETASNCDLMELGNPFDLKGYGIATQKNSPFTESVSTQFHVLQLVNPIKMHTFFSSLPQNHVLRDGPSLMNTSEPTF
jgi:hypothetical protein